MLLEDNRIIHQFMVSDYRDIDRLAQDSELYEMFDGNLVDNYIIMDEDIHIDDYSALYIICIETAISEWTSHTHVIMTDSEELMLEYKMKWSDNDE